MSFTLLRRSSSSAVGNNVLRRLQGMSAPSPVYRAPNYHNQNVTRNNRFETRLFSSKETVTITYIDPDGTEHPVEADIGKNLLDVAHDNNIELEGKLYRFKLKANQYAYRNKKSQSSSYFLP